MFTLMNSNTDFGEFQKKYNNFMVPSYEISIDGMTISQRDLSITNISIKLSAKEGAGMANFSVSNCYSLKEKGFKSNLKLMFKLGSIVRISLGYSNVNKELFRGYIDSISYKLGDVPEIDINCMDVIAVLMKNKVEERKRPGITVKQAISDILKKYKKFIKNSKIDELQSVYNQIVQDEDDYKFIKKIADKNNCDFFAVGSKVFVSNLKKKKDIATTLDYGINVMHFSREVQFNNFEVTAYGKNDSNNNTVSGKYVHVTQYDYVNYLEETCEKIIIRSPQIDNETIANVMAFNKAEKLIDRGYSSNIECIGIPELVPGRYVTLKNFDRDIDGSFYITVTTHNYSPGKYTVSLNISNS